MRLNGRLLLVAAVFLLTSWSNGVGGHLQGNLAPDIGAPGDTPKSLHDGAVYEIHLLYFPKGEAHFKTLAARIPELADLGVKTVYLMPFFLVSALRENATDLQRLENQYNIEDYRIIDPYYGTAGDLKTLIATAHKYGIRVLFDMCLNHTYPPSTFFEKGWLFRIALRDLEMRAASRAYPVRTEAIGSATFKSVNPHLRPDRKIIYDFRGVLFGDAVYALHYPADNWWFAVDAGRPDLIQYMVDLTKYFIQEFDFDGWRLDAPSNNWNPEYFGGDHSQLALLRALKNAMVHIKPGAVLISENAKSGQAAGDPNDFDEVAEASYNPRYFLSTLANAGVRYPSRGMANLGPFASGDLLQQLVLENIQNGRSRLRYSETHDSPRINEENADRNRALFAFNAALLPGIPMIQAGQEIGATSLLYSIPTSGYDERQRQLRDYYRRVLTLRNKSNALKYGSLANVLAATTGKEKTRIYSCLRSFEDEKVVVMINFSGVEVRNKLRLPFVSGSILSDQLNGDKFTVTESTQIPIPAFGARILIQEK
jgi:glycosidase